MKKSIFVFTFIALIGLPLTTFAVSDRANQNARAATPTPQVTSSGLGDVITSPTPSSVVSPTSSPKNRGNSDKNKNKENNSNKPTSSPRSQTAYEHMSQVALAVENLIRVSDRLERGLGEQVREIAQSQNESEDRVVESVDKANGRSGFAKFFIGPNYKALKVIKQEIDGNDLRIRKLNRILSQVTNENDKTELQNQITLLKEQNTALQKDVDEMTEGFSLFGWVAKLKNGY